MKKIHLSIYRSLLFCCLIYFFMYKAVFAYETVVVQFPYGNWKSVYYDKGEQESIVRYIPYNQTKDNAVESLVLYANKSIDKSVSSLNVMNRLLKKVFVQDPSLKVYRVKTNPYDAMAYWSSSKLKGKATQCEVVYVTRAHNGVVSMHYITNDISRFYKVKDLWIEALKGSKVYYSYYRWDRLMNKVATFEL